MRLKSRYFLIPLLLAAVCCQRVEIDDPEPEQPSERPDTALVAPEGCNTYGRVVVNGKGLQDVVVSDGFVVTTTDTAGVYSFTSDKKHGYVFISIPSGYEVGSKGVLPQFYRYYLKPAGTAERFDFKLVEADQKDYTVLFFGDMHLANRSVFKDVQQFREFTDDVNGLMDSSLGKTYAITLGDMAWDYFWTANNYDLTDYLNEVNDDFGDRLQIFHTMGNHDNDSAYEGDFLAEATYKTVVGPSYYSFNIGGIHYIVLDDIEYRNYASTGSSRDFYKDIAEPQAEWLQKDLEHVSKSTPLVITMHSPLYYDNGNVSLYNGYNGLIKYLAGYKSTFVTGHTHVVYNVDRTTSGVSVYESNSGAVCGAWWVTASNSGIHLSGDGAPGGYRIMSVSGDKWSWRFKGTGRSEEYQFRSYDRNNIWLRPEDWTPNATASGKKAFSEAVGSYGSKSSANEVLLNVWDYDPSWKIEVTENGHSLPVKRLSGVKDPLYLVCYEAYEYEHHYDNTVYYPADGTSHMFSVTASSPSSTLEIEVTDREGRVYHETMTRPKSFSISRYRK